MAVSTRAPVCASFGLLGHGERTAAGLLTNAVVEIPVADHWIERKKIGLSLWMLPDLPQDDMLLVEAVPQLFGEAVARLVVLLDRSQA